VLKPIFVPNSVAHFGDFVLSGSVSDVIFAT